MIEIDVTRLPESENVEIKRLEFSDQSVIRFVSFLASMSGDSDIQVNEYDDKHDHIGSYCFKAPGFDIV